MKTNKRNRVRTNANNRQSSTQLQTAAPAPGESATRAGERVAISNSVPSSSEDRTVNPLREAETILEEAIAICTALNESMSASLRDYCQAPAEKSEVGPHHTDLPRMIFGFEETLGRLHDQFQIALSFLRGAEPQSITLQDAHCMLDSAAAEFDSAAAEFDALCRGRLSMLREAFLTAKAGDGLFTREYFGDLNFGFHKLWLLIEESFRGGYEFLEEEIVKAYRNGGAQ